MIVSNPKIQTQTLGRDKTLTFQAFTDRLMIYRAEEEIWKRLSLNEVVMILADKRHCKLVLESRANISIRYIGINKMEQRLRACKNMIRIHRSHMINLDYLQGVDQSWSHALMKNQVDGRYFISIGPDYKEGFKNALQREFILLGPVSNEQA